MSDKIDNEFIYELLKKLQSDIAKGFAVTAAEIAQLGDKVGAMAQTLVGVQRDIRDLKRETSGLKDQIGTLGAAVDEHTKRLDRIDAHLGLNNPRH